MTMRFFAVAACIVTFVSHPAGAGQPNLPNGDAVDVINVNVVRSPLATTPFNRQVTFDLCGSNLFNIVAGIPLGPNPIVKACPPLGPPIVCTGGSVFSVTPFGACQEFLCLYNLLVARDPRGTTGTSLAEGNELLDTRFTFTPTLEGLTGVDGDEYNMLIGLGKNPQKGYLATREDDPSVTFMIIRERAEYTNSTLPDTDPGLFADGFESGDTAAWSAGESPTDLSTVP